MTEKLSEYLQEIKRKYQEDPLRVTFDIVQKDVEFLKTKISQFSNDENLTELRFAFSQTLFDLYYRCGSIYGALELAKMSGLLLEGYSEATQNCIKLAHCFLKIVHPQLNPVERAKIAVAYLTEAYVRLDAQVKKGNIILIQQEKFVEGLLLKALNAALGNIGNQLSFDEIQKHSHFTKSFLNFAAFKQKLFFPPKLSYSPDQISLLGFSKFFEANKLENCISISGSELPSKITKQDVEMSEADEAETESENNFSLTS